MIDPLFLLVLGSALSVMVRLGADAAEVWLLRKRARLTAVAARLPAGTELGGHGRDGVMWFVLARGAETTRTEVGGLDH